MKKTILSTVAALLLFGAAFGIYNHDPSVLASSDFGAGSAAASAAGRRLQDHGINVPFITTIATTSTTDTYVQVPRSGTVIAAYYGGATALAASDTNYITFSITNLGSGGAGSTALLAATAVNTTQATGGTALTANAVRTLTLSGTSANLSVTEGDTLRVRASVTGTLGGAISNPRVTLLIRTNGA